MTTEELFNVLRDHQGKALLFEYLPNLYVAGNYHITEVKHVKIDAVDCGAQSDNWNETIIQLWESPSESPTKKHMSAYKALSILKKVGRIKSYDFDAEVKFEYSNTNFHTAQLFVNDYIIQDGHLIFKLAIQKTDCKAKDICGIPETVDVSVQASCEPGSGCC